MILIGTTTIRVLNMKISFTNIMIIEIITTTIVIIV